MAAEHIADSYNTVVNQTGEQPVFLLWDFKWCDITTHLPGLEKYVTTPTGIQHTLDLCYGNIPDAYISKPRPPLGRSDHYPTTAQIQVTTENQRTLNKKSSESGIKKQLKQCKAALISQTGIYFLMTL